MDSNMHTISLRLAMVVVAIVSTLTVWSREYEVESFEPMLMDLTARTQPRLDGNGRKCAVLKVYVSDRIAEVRGNVIGEIKSTGGMEKQIYITPGSKQVELVFDNHYPLHIRFSDYDCPYVAEQSTYVVKLREKPAVSDSDSRQDTPGLKYEDPDAGSFGAKKVYMQKVQFNVRPKGSDAVVMVQRDRINSKEEMFGHAGNGKVAGTLEYGAYTYKVMAKNYVTVVGRFTLDDKDIIHVENIDLLPNYSDITFKVDADAEIYVNGELKGTREWTGRLTAGNYYVECREPGHRSSYKTVEVVGNDNHTVSLEAPSPITGTVAFMSNPLGADISIDGKSFGRTPRSIDLPVGRHVAGLSMSGYKPETKSFDVAENELREINVSLKAHTPMVTEQPRIPSENKKKVSSYRDSYFYAEAGVGLGAAMNATVGVGGYFRGFNLEFDYSYCFKESPYLGWDIIMVLTKYKPSLIWAFKAGCALAAGNRIDIVPQVGCRVTSFSEVSDLSTPMVDGAYCSCLTVGVKGVFKVIPHVGVAVMPEYAVGVRKSTGYKVISSVGSKITGLAEGFSTKISIMLTF